MLFDGPKILLQCISFILFYIYMEIYIELLCVAGIFI